MIVVSVSLVYSIQLVVTGKAGWGEITAHVVNTIKDILHAVLTVKTQPEWYSSPTYNFNDAIKMNERACRCSGKQKPLGWILHCKCTLCECIYTIWKAMNEGKVIVICECDHNISGNRESQSTSELTVCFRPGLQYSM